MRGNDIAVNPLGFLGEPFDEGGRIRDFAARFRQRLALLQRHQHRQIVLMLQHQIEPSAQEGRALLSGSRPPTGESVPSRRDRPIDFDNPQLGHAAERFARGWIGHRKSFLMIGIHPGATDITLLMKQARIFQMHGKLRRFAEDRRLTFQSKKQGLTVIWIA